MLCIFQKNGIDKLHLLNNLIEFCLDYSVVFNDAVCYGLPILIVRKIILTQILELGQEELPRSTFIVWDSVNQSLMNSLVVFNGEKLCKLECRGKKRIF